MLSWIMNFPHFSHCFMIPIGSFTGSDRVDFVYLGIFLSPHKCEKSIFNDRQTTSEFLVADI